MKLVLAVFVTVAAPGIAGAQILEDEVIVTAPLEGAQIESLQGAEILRRDQIVESLNGSLGDTLEALPGVSSTFYGAGASRPIIRGLGEDRVRVLENGIGAIDASTASPDHAVTADALDAHRIEVLRGAAALAYGGNAVGGVVNVIDESIPTRASDGTELDVLAAYSSVDAGRQGGLDLHTGAGPVAFHLGAAARETEDYETPLGDAPNSWTSFATYGAGGSLVGDWGYAGLAVKRTTNDYGLPPEDPSEPGGHIELEQTRIEWRGDVKIDVGPFDRLDFSGQRADYEHTEIEGSGDIGTVFTNEGWEGRLEAHHRGDRLEGAVGLQVIDTDFAAEGEEAFITPTSTRDLGLFAIERWDTGVWGLEGGARYETREIENDGGGARDFDAVSVSAGAFLRPAANWFVGGTLARTERAPTAIELFSDGPHHATETYEIGDSNLNKEIALSFELSTRFETDPVAIELSLFRIAFEDYIALAPTGLAWGEDSGIFDPSAPPPPPEPDEEVLDVFRFVQQDASFTGGELSARATLWTLGDLKIGADGALEIVRAEFDGGGNPPRIPPRTLTLGLSATSEQWAARVEAVDVADQDRTADFETATEGYTFVNARLTYRPEGLGGDTRFILDARNLGDEEGRVHASFLKDALPLPGRNLRLTVTTAF